MFDLALSDIEVVFSRSSWNANGIKTVPDNYQGKIGNGIREYVLIKLLPSNGWNYAYDAKKMLSGMLAVKIFTAAGSGQGRAMEVADLLNVQLQNKRLTNGTELGTSYVNVEGLDSSNNSLYSVSYFIPFKLYGE